mgnify:CR=1 FL=1
MAEPSKFLPYQDKNGDFLIDQCEIDLPGPIEKVCLDCKPNPKALVDMKKSLMYIDDAVKVVSQLLDESGTINVGGKSQSVYDFVKETNSEVGEIYLYEIDDVNMATDCSMDTSKMKRILSEL